jgi:hypothetical protein
MFSTIRKDQGGMIELILDKNIQFLGQLESEIIHQMSGVGTPGQGNNFDGIPLGAQILNQFTVIQISAADRVEGAVDDKSNMHFDVVQRFNVQTFERSTL